MKRKGEKEGRVPWIVTMGWDKGQRPERLRVMVGPEFWRLGARARRLAYGELAVSVRAWLAEVAGVARGRSARRPVRHK